MEIKQKVNNTITSIYSNSEIVKYGVPQGSVLSPLLFILYVNDMPKTVGLPDSVIMYADDTSYVVTSSSTETLQEKASLHMKSGNNYFKENNLFINGNKTTYM